MTQTPLDNQQTTALTDIGLRVRDRERLEIEIAECVARAWMFKCSWAKIGLMLGTSGQAAWERYRPNKARPTQTAQDPSLFDSDNSEDGSVAP